MTAPPRLTAGWLIFALALALRLAFVATLDERLAWPDERDHVAIGQHLAAGEGFVASSYRNAPVLPAYLGLVFRAFGESYLAARAGQALLGALTCVLVYRTASLLVSPAAGALSGVLLAVYPQQIYLAGVFYTSCLETFFCAAYVTLAARVLRGRAGIPTAALCGVVLGLTVLTRPVFLALAPCVAAVWVCAGEQPWPRALAACAALALGAAATVLPWSARNHAVYGRFMLVSSGGGVTLWKGNNELADGTAGDRVLGPEREEWLARLQRLEPAPRAALVEKYARLRERVGVRQREVGDYYLALDDVYGPVGRAYIAAEPGRALRRSIRKVRTFFSAFTRTETDALPGWSAALAAATFYPLLLLAVLGPAFAPGRAGGLVLPYLVVGSMAAVHAALTSCTRFRLPVDPYVIMGAAFAIGELRTWRWTIRGARRRRRRASAR